MLLLLTAYVVIRSSPKRKPVAKGGPTQTLELTGVRASIGLAILQSKYYHGPNLLHLHCSPNCYSASSDLDRLNFGA